MYILLDADSVVWKAAAASQTRLWTLTRPGTGELLKAFPGKKKREIIKEHKDELGEGELILVCLPGPVEHALQIAKTMVTNIYNAVIDSKANTLSDASPVYKLYLTPVEKTCFRYAVAKTVGYKSTRPSGKPPHFEAVREYLIKNWGARICEAKYEADDAIGIEATAPGISSDCIIASIDKDLRMIPGWHYNYDTKELDYINEWEAAINWARQMLTGDTSDSIPGLRRIGKVKADRLLKEWVSTVPHVKGSDEWHDALTLFLHDFYIAQGYTSDYFSEMDKLLTIITYSKEIPFDGC